MERFAAGLFSPVDAVESNRLRLLQWALGGVMRRLDEEEEGAYSGGWIDPERVGDRPTDGKSAESRRAAEKAPRRDQTIALFLNQVVLASIRLSHARAPARR